MLLVGMVGWRLQRTALAENTTQIIMLRIIPQNHLEVQDLGPGLTLGSYSIGITVQFIKG